MILPNDSTPGSSGEFDPKSIMRFLERSQRKASETDADKAQDLYFEAMDAPSKAAQFDLLEKALKLDPGNPDVLLAMLRHLPTSASEEIEILRRIVQMGEERLGENTFEEYSGHFWGFVETRPYMRARAQLAEALNEGARVEEAMSEWEGMLALNPNDNQGIRYRLLPVYLSLGRRKEAGQLFKKYPEAEFNTVFAWGQVLELFLSGDQDMAAEAALEAQKQNGFSKAFILGHRRVPKNLPDAYSPGSKEEAACFASDLRLAWEAHPAALAWLAGRERA